jgi:hypothetical protein
MLLALVALTPFLGVELPSMTDLPGHIGRYHVMMNIEASEHLKRFYAFEWKLVGNLGLDLVVRALAPFFGVKRAALIATAAIPLLTIAGVAAVSRALYGRIEPSAAIACCFVFSNPFLYGFVNYSLSVALALLTFAGWIRMSSEATRKHLLIFIPLVFAVWLSHAMGWGILALMVGGLELNAMLRRYRGAEPLDLVRVGTRLLPFAPPVIATLVWSSGGEGPLFAYAAGDELWRQKIHNFLVVLRGQGRFLDVGTPVILFLTAAVLLLLRRLRVDWRMASGGILLVGAVLVVPTTLFRSWGADERLAPVALIALSLSLVWDGNRRGAFLLAAFASSLFTVRTLAIGEDWRQLDVAYRSHLKALDQVPRGARIYAIVLYDQCETTWVATALPHLPDLAIVEKDALVNSQFPPSLAPLLKVTYGDPKLRTASQMIPGFDCSTRDLSRIEARLAELPLGGADYIWLLNTQGSFRVECLGAPLYRDENSALFTWPKQCGPRVR